jgi:hypothetical protein
MLQACFRLSISQAIEPRLFSGSRQMRMRQFSATAHYPIDLYWISVIAAMVKSKPLLTNLLSTRGKLAFEPRSLVAVASTLSARQLRSPRVKRRPRHAADVRHPTPCDHAHALRGADDHVPTASGRQVVYTDAFSRCPVELEPATQKINDHAFSLFSWSGCEHKPRFSAQLAMSWCF